MKCKLNATNSEHQIAFLSYFFLHRTSLVVIKKNNKSLKNNDASPMLWRYIKNAYATIAFLPLYVLN